MPGDGGLVVIPGSHKSDFLRPTDLFVTDDDTLDPAPASCRDQYHTPCRRCGNHLRVTHSWGLSLETERPGASLPDYAVHAAVYGLCILCIVSEGALGPTIAGDARTDRGCRL